eukprot:PhF_6_TR39559/c0_g1_i1/m.58657
MTTRERSVGSCGTPSIGSRAAQTFDIPEVCCVMRPLCTACYRLIASHQLLDHSCQRPATPMEAIFTLKNSLDAYLNVVDNPDYLWQRCEHYRTLRQAFSKLKELVMRVFILLARPTVTSHKISQQQYTLLIEPLLKDFSTEIPNCGSDLSERFEEFEKETKIILAKLEITN